VKVAIGCDPYGFELKENVKRHLIDRGMEVIDLGARAADEDQAYYDVAAEVASQVSQGDADRGVLVCGTGMGMAIIANKFPGVYAAVCENAIAAQRARSINNANVLTLGGFVTPPEAAGEIVDAWLQTEFAFGWEPDIQAFLGQSIGHIHAIEDQVFRGSAKEKPIATSQTESS
jgi:ribose 5-phosphate isomerase B